MPTERRLRINISLSCKSPVDVVDKLLILLNGPLRNYSHELTDKDEGDWAWSWDYPDDDSLGVVMAIRSIPKCEVDIEQMMHHAGCNDDTIAKYVKQRDERDKGDDDKEGQLTS